MSTIAINEATITVPFKYVWNIDPQSLSNWTNGKIVDSPLFEPENFNMIKFKLQLSYISNHSIELFCVSSMEKSLNLKYKIIFNQTSNTNPEIKNDIKLSTGQKCTISNEYISVVSIQCEFELNFPEKLIPPLVKLAKELNSLRLNSRFTDVIFVVGTREFPANKMILSVRSPVFSVMFSREDFVENRQNRVDITDIDENVFEGLLDFIYTTQVKMLDQIAPELLVAAHKYEISSLVEMCAQSMIKTITTKTVVNYLLHANMYNLAELKSKTIDFINTNVGTIIQSEEWTKHVQPNHSLMIELYRDMAAKHPK